MKLSQRLVSIYDNQVQQMNDQMDRGNEHLTGMELTNWTFLCYKQCGNCLRNQIIKLINDSQQAHHTELDISLNEFTTMLAILKEGSDDYLWEDIEDFINELRLKVN